MAQCILQCCWSHLPASGPQPVRGRSRRMGHIRVQLAARRPPSSRGRAWRRGRLVLCHLARRVSFSLQQCTGSGYSGRLELRGGGGGSAAQRWQPSSARRAPTHAGVPSREVSRSLDAYARSHSPRGFKCCAECRKILAIGIHFNLAKSDLGIPKVWSRLQPSGSVD
jgi:hypothetical protein